MTEANLGIYSMLKPRKSAFDYFVQGQEAKQNYESNQQMMAARQQAMAQSEHMYPLLLDAQRAGIAGTEATTAYNQFQTDRGEKLLPGQLEQQVLEATNTQGIIDARSSGEQRANEMLPIQIAQAKAATGASRASTRASNLEIDTFKKEQANQNILLGEKAVAQYEALQQTNPEIAEKFKTDALSKFGLTEDQFNPDFIKAQAAVIKKMQPGNYEQVKDMPGIAFNKDTGTYTASAEQMQKSIDRANETKGLFDGKTIRDVTNDLRSETKVAKDAKAAANKLLSLGENATPTDQIAAMYNFIKSLDPGGVVTDRENGMLATSEGALQGIVNLYNKSVLGEGSLKNLMPQMIQTAVSMANSQIESTREGIESTLNVYSSNKNITENQANNFRGLIPETIKYDGAAANKSTPAIPGGTQRIKMSQDDLKELLGQ